MDILFLISEKMLSVSIFNIMLAIDLLYIAIILTNFHVFLQFPELLSQKHVELCKWVFSIHWNNSCFSLCEFVYMLYSICWFMYVETPLPFGNEVYLVIMCNLPNIFLDSVCKHFVRNFFNITFLLTLQEFHIMHPDHTSQSCHVCPPPYFVTSPPNKLK